MRKPYLRTNKIYSHIQYKTLRLPCLNYYHYMFYHNGKKVICTNISRLRSLAYWIMDDGGVDGGTYLHTRSYTKDEVQLLCSVLFNKFGITRRIYEKVLNQWVIPKSQNKILYELLVPYMHSSMLYKISEKV